MKILITGGTGFIGSHTAVELIHAGHDVEILDNLENSKLSVLDAIQEITGTKPQFFQADLLNLPDLTNILKTGDYDAVIHFAGLKAVAESVEKPLLYYRNNVIGTLSLLSAMQESSVKNLIFSSSATVYGDPGVTAYTEDLETGRNIPSPYGKTKYMIEEILKSEAAADPDFSVSILRYFNPIGAHPSGALGENPNGRPNNLMPIIMKVAARKYKELSVYGNDYPTRDGTCVRDYIHVIDLARGHLKSLEHIKPGVSIYNLGSGTGTSVLELISAFQEISGQPLPYKFAPRRAGDLPEFYAVPEKARRELGWQTELTIKDAIKDSLNFLAHQQK